MNNKILWRIGAWFFGSAICLGIIFGSMTLGIAIPFLIAYGAGLDPAEAGLIGKIGGMVFVVLGTWWSMKFIDIIFAPVIVHLFKARRRAFR